MPTATTCSEGYKLVNSRCQLSGANLPTMKEELEKILRTVLIVPDDPIFSNAIGFEDISRKEMNVSIRSEQIKSNIDIDLQGVDRIST